MQNNDTKTVLGSRPPRVDALAKVTGRAQYTADMELRLGEGRGRKGSLRGEGRGGENWRSKLPLFDTLVTNGAA